LLACFTSRACLTLCVHSEARLTLGSKEDALILRNSLMVDPELQPTKVTRSMTIEGDDANVLRIQVTATEARLLRPAVSTLMDLAVACSKAIETFAH